MTDVLSTVLARVAAGELSPDEALELLGPEPGSASGSGAGVGVVTRSDVVGAGQARRPRWEPPVQAPQESVRRVVLRTPSRSVQVWADPSVYEISVSGSHQLQRVGDDLVVENPSTGSSAGRFSIVSLARAIPATSDNLVVRMNPALALDLDVAAAAVKLHGLQGDLKLRLLASSLKVDGTAGAVDLEAISSSVKGGMVINRPSRIDCESSSVKVTLHDGSDVLVRARNRMGKVILPGSTMKGSIAEPDLVEARIGDGTHSLTIDAVMSSVILGNDHIG